MDIDMDTDADTGHGDFKKWGHRHGRDATMKYTFIYFYLLSRIILHL